ncbi:hypothetical protein CR194_15115 [Salipaludibacillus keqinensis]|uniref:Uncharacterized protein n=1 Tax=Salipaludibacillus keqinensis TaxID=2045207 RepID=A0A323T9I8_9BACI|nr:hypothetical protein [Salipaludibacillus keqinensis]PYZ92171.1 hypothetical protein CR194_15115 [Salipaludibacillus keqinensis]
MKEKKVKLGIGISALLVVLIGGILFYSFISSPEVKLARAFESLSQEDQAQVTSTMDMSIDLDMSASELGMYGEEEIFFDMMQSMLDNISGTSTVVWDNENKVVEMNATYGISGDIQGEDIHLQVPFSLYLDENGDEVAFDLEPYVDFTSEAIDVISYNVLPNIPELQEDLELLAEGEDVGDFLSTELNQLVVPIIEDTLRGKKYSEPLDIDENIFREDEDERYLLTFILENMLEYMKEHNEEDIVTEDDNWITVSLEEEMFFDSLLYALREVEKDEEAKKTFEETYEEDIETTISDLEEARDDLEDVSLSLTASFLVKQNTIHESQMDFTLTFEEDGQNVNVAGTVTSEYSYGEEADFLFYGQDREEITEEELDQMGYEIEMTVDNYMMENYQYEDEYMYEDEYEVELTEEEQELIEAIEAEEVTHDDFALTPEEMYYWVIDLEMQGLVEQGTSDLYMPSN